MRTYFFVLLVLGLSACQAPSTTPPTTTAAAPNQLTQGEVAAGWKLLFDGTSLNGWHVWGHAGQPVTGWEVKDGELIALGVTEHGADLLTQDPYESFELLVDWKVSPGGNSGILFHVVEDTARYGAVYFTGPEYQLVDDIGFPEKLEDTQKSACNYGMHPVASPPSKPAGEWNTSRLLVDGTHVEHWLNGQKTVEYEMWSPDWEARKAAGKWKDYPDYGLARTGFISLQDHGLKTWFRNVKIRPIVRQGGDSDGD